MNTELKARLAKAKAEIAEIQKAMEPDEDAALLAEVEAAELEAANARAIAKAVEEHGPLGAKVAAIDTRLGVIVVKRPNHLHFRRFQDASEVTTETLDRLVRPCVVYPSHERFDAMLEELPAVLTELGREVSVLAGMKAKETAGKS